MKNNSGFSTALDDYIDSHLEKIVLSRLQAVKEIIAEYENEKKAKEEE